MQRKLLSVNDLNINFDAVKAVQGISFDLYSGETIGIVGESGSGKSVTALSILRLLSENPTSKVSGQILYHQSAEKVVDLTTISASEIQQIRGNKIAMVFQEPLTSLNPTMPCGEQMFEVLRCHKKLADNDAKKTVLSLLESVKIDDPERAYHAFPHELSGGQKQRIMIGMAICCQPELLIADEPTTSLDVTIQKSLLELLKQFKDESSMSLIFISHDLGLISEIADRVLVMKEGQIVEQGTTKEIFSNPRHPYTKGLLACLPPLDVKLNRLPVLADFTKAAGLEGSDFDYKTILDSYKLSAEEIENRNHTVIQSKVLLKVENLCTWFPLAKDRIGKTVDYFKAVDGVSFDVREGETLGLVGESGCGKTTLSRTLLRLIPSTSGKMYFRDAVINEKEGNALLSYRKEVQLIFQDPYSALNPRMSVGNAIIEPMQFHQLLRNEKERREKVDYLMRAVGLDCNLFYRFPFELSGGQRQRIVIARALAVEPSLLICDECVSALDVSVQAQVLNLLMDLRKQFNLSCIFISHDLAVVKHMSERMMVMNNGKIEEAGFATEIYRNPQSDYTGRLIESIPGRNIF